ncbi:MAG: 2OG-Fe(II) oxygenase [Vicinamibacterales bacterium]
MPHASPEGLLILPSFLDASDLEAAAAALDADAGEAAEVQAPGRSRWAVDVEVRRAWEVVLPVALLDALIVRLDGVRPLMEARLEARLDPCDAVAAMRYPVGAFYRTHKDTSDDPEEDLARRAVSMVVFLNDGDDEPAAASTAAASSCRTAGASLRAAGGAARPGRHPRRLPLTLAARGHPGDARRAPDAGDLAPAGGRARRGRVMTGAMNACGRVGAHPAARPGVTRRGGKRAWCLFRN